jgi:GTP pyrophosphokinase
MSLPRGATVVDFAYAVHSRIGDHCVAAKINGQLVPLRTELNNGDLIEVTTAPVSHPNPSWLSFVRTGRARSKIRHYLKTQAHTQSEKMGSKLLLQAVRAEGFDAPPKIAKSDIPGAMSTSSAALWEKLLKFSGNKTAAELYLDIGLGKRIASVIAKRIAALMIENGAKPDPTIVSQELWQSAEGSSQQTIWVDGDESAGTRFASCCRPIPGDAILGYLGHGEGLVIHRTNCAAAIKLTRKDQDRMMEAQWADDIERTFPAFIRVSVRDGQGVLAQVTAAIAQAEANIVHIEMGAEIAELTTELSFQIAIKNLKHLNAVMKGLMQIPPVVNVQRV